MLRRQPPLFPISHNQIFLVKFGPRHECLAGGPAGTTRATKLEDSGVILTPVVLAVWIAEPAAA
jgi:hypothetical protein